MPASRFSCEHLRQNFFWACISRIHAQVPVVTTGQLAKTLRQEEVIQWATQHNFLNGAVISDVLETMTGSGFKQSNHVHDDGPARSVNWTDSALLSNAISLGPLGYDRNHRRTLIGGHHP